MEYFINVYSVVRNLKTHISVEHFEQRKDAIQDIEFMSNQESASKYTYIHSIWVVKNFPAIIDLSGESA